MVINLSERYALLSSWLCELREIQSQSDRMRFRYNLERVGELAALEISKQLEYEDKEIQTPLGLSTGKVLKSQPALATILRAGLPLHNGMLRIFDKADNVFIAAYRRHMHDSSLEVDIDYISAPEIDGRVLIVSDPMIATGASLAKTLQYLLEEGRPKEIHVVAAVACTVGIAHVLSATPDITIWCAGIDEELTAKGYIVPGLGDAGDLSFGPGVPL
ncbi:MAG: uracil phosphoribosyltransferase [Chitinophagaceae bacterium]|nr:uracil phosphoribosyltransferase [Chitinophagaceae bacterium]